MAWIKIVEAHEATEQLKDLYDRWRQRGWDREPEMPEVVRVFSLRPELMDVRIRFGDRMTFGGSGLGRFREELIAVSISAALACRY